MFLPAAGSRDGSGVSDVGDYGYYWSSTARGTVGAFSLGFYSGNVYPAGSYNRSYGISVRLVSVAQ